MKKILVTGGTTFVSKYVAKYFVNMGYEVYVLNRNTKSQVRGVKLIEGDRHNLNGILKNLSFDAVADITAYNEKDIIDFVKELGSYGQYIILVFTTMSTIWMCLVKVRYSRKLQL